MPAGCRVRARVRRVPPRWRLLATTARRSAPRPSRCREGWRYSPRPARSAACASPGPPQGRWQASSPKHDCSRERQERGTGTGLASAHPNLLRPSQCFSERLDLVHDASGGEQFPKLLSQLLAGFAHRVPGADPLRVAEADEVLPVRNLSVGKPRDECLGRGEEERTLEVVGRFPPPAQRFVEPARNHVGIEVGIEHQALAWAEVQVRVVIQDAAIPVRALGGSGDVHAAHHQGNGAGGEERGPKVLAREGVVHRGQVPQARERAVVPGGVEHGALHLERERAPAQRVGQGRDGQPRHEHPLLLAGRGPSAQRRHDVQPCPGVAHDVLGPVRAEQGVEDAGTGLGDERGRRLGRIALIQVRGRKALERRQGVFLCQACEAPAADGRADEVQGAGAGLAQEFAEEHPVQPGEHQPLGPARGSGEDIHVLGAQAALAQEPQGAGSCPEREGRGHVPPRLPR
ncbi:hypothetical protein STIAU_0755 [Stigmatella aurantiaca DW4/3-1]|uniref:Uncharacterized protein n=1 Tax=Stigmatella aurantiaca (strain DW4/3-1) TaxID=378806 RepID=Q08YV6_STIAD|nr:hypothetical protein STIAU_0755 [Stigmatella aurantiaca DW4/3-1]